MNTQTEVSEKTISQSEFIKNSGHINPKLIKAVINQIGGWEQFEQSAPDITNHGINGGFGGFIYYSETHSFAIKNRATIVELLEEQAAQLGDSDMVSMVASFGVFRNSPMDAEDKKDLYRFLGGGRPQQGAITNIMAWFAGEEVARAYNDYLENNK